MRTRETDKACTELRQAAKDTEGFLDRFSVLSEKLGQKTSSSLFGTFGGLTGLLGGVGLAHVAGLGLLLASTPLTGIGILGGILCFRGLKHFALERIINKNRLAGDEYLRRIKELPANAPQDVKDDLWQKYRNVNAVLESQTRRLLEPPPPKTDRLLPASPAAPGLPAPSAASKFTDEK